MNDLAQSMEKLHLAEPREALRLARELVENSSRLFAGCAGELVPEFNEILRNAPTCPSDLYGSLTRAHAAFCTAAVLYEIGNLEGMVSGCSQQVRLGWNGINMDAKGWVKLLIAIKPPDTLEFDVLMRVVAAKGFGAMLPPCDPPIIPRSVLECDRRVILKVTVDE